MSDIVINNTSSTSEYAISINQLETNLFEINVDTSVNKYDISINDQSSNFNTTIESDNSQYSIELIPKLDICELIVYKDATIPLDFDPSSNQNITGNWTFNPTTYFNNGIGVVGTVSTNLHGDSEDWYTAYLHSQMTSGNPHNITLADIDINFAEINYWTKINDKLSYIGDVSIDMNMGGSNTLNSNGINLGNITGNRQISNYTLLNNVGTDINIYDDLSSKYYNNGVANIQKLGVIRFAYDMQSGDFDSTSGSSKFQIFLRNGAANIYDESTLFKRFEIDKYGQIYFFSTPPDDSSNMPILVRDTSTGVIKQIYKQLAGTGVTYGYIDDQSQTIVGKKTYQNLLSPSINENYTHQYIYVGGSGNVGSNILTGLHVKTYPAGTGYTNTTEIAQIIECRGAQTTGRSVALKLINGDLIIAKLPATGANTDEIIVRNATDGSLRIIDIPSGGLAGLTSPTFATSINGSYLTASTLLAADASKNIVSLPVSTYPSLSELAYVKGTTENIQAKLNSIPTNYLKDNSNDETTGILTAKAFRTNVSNVEYNLITRDSTGAALYVKNAQASKIASFQYGTATANAGYESVGIDNNGLTTKALFTNVIDGSLAQISYSAVSHTFRNTSTGTATLFLARQPNAPTIKALGDTPANKWFMIDSSGEYLSLNHYCADNVVIAKGGGNVGIGIVPSTYKFDVLSTDSGIVNFTSSNGGNFSVDKFGNTRINYNNLQKHYLGSIGGSDISACGVHYIYDGNQNKTISLNGIGNSYFNCGYVGFGTDTPLYQVHVKTTGASFGSVVNESTNSSYGAAYYLGNDKSSTAAYLILYGSTHSSLPSQLALKNKCGEIAFFTGTDTTNAKMRILSNGYVGINTTEPLYMLDINESRASYFTTRIKNTSSTGYGVHIQAGGTTQDILRLSNYSGAERFAFYGDGKIKLAGKTYSFPSNTEVNDYVLTTNGSGGLSWSSKTGGGVLTGVASINGDSSTAQSILAGTGISITNSGASHTISASFEETDDLNDVVSRGSTTTKSITALKFIKSGGTSAQFLKANGDSDSNTYLTAITKALVESVLTGNIISHTHNYTNYAEPGIFSGGGSPSLATGVTGAEIRTLIGAGTSSTIGTVTSVIAGTAITITGTSTVSPVINVSLGTGYEQSARGNHNHDSTYQDIGVYLSSLIATKDIPTGGLLRKTSSTTVDLDASNYLTSVTQIQVIPDGYTYITTSWNLSINENVYTSKSNTTALTTTLSNVVDGSSGIYIIDTTAAFILTLAHTGYAWYADENAPTTSTAKRLQLAVGRHIITFTAKGASNAQYNAIYINVASYKSF